MFIVIQPKKLKNLIYITFALEFLPLIFCLFFLKKIITKYLKVFFVYTILLAVFTSISLLFIYYFKSFSEYYLTLRFYNIVEYSILAFFIIKLLRNKPIITIVKYSIIPFISYCVVDFLISDKSKFGNGPVIIEFLIFMLILVYYFYEKMKYVKSYPLSQSLSFWLCVGLFIYFTGNFFYLLFVASSKNPLLIKQLRTVYFFVNISKDIILSLAWLAHEPTEEENVELYIPDDVHLDDEFTFTNKFINS